MRHNPWNTSKQRRLDKANSRVLSATIRRPIAPPQPFFSAPPPCPTRLVRQHENGSRLMERL